ncbi:hypothetical protein JMJ77_0013852, partial [Colletotrichum scovillei]
SVVLRDRFCLQWLPTSHLPTRIRPALCSEESGKRKISSESITGLMSLPPPEVFAPNTSS